MIIKMDVNIPIDILNKIDLLFQTEFSRKEAQQILSSFWHKKLNVGAEQLARSILVLSDGDLNILKDISVHMRGDPRDLIMQAERKLGNPGHYFTIPLS